MMVSSLAHINMIRGTQPRIELCHHSAARHRRLRKANGASPTPLGASASPPTAPTRPRPGSPFQFLMERRGRLQVSPRSPTPSQAMSTRPLTSCRQTNSSQRPSRSSRPAIWPTSL
jgi:hypothetical protein